MGITSRCKGISLLNHINQKNIDYSIDYSFNNVADSWKVTFKIYGEEFIANGHNKSEAKIKVMEDAENLIISNLTIRK